MQEIIEFTSANPWLVLGLIASALALIFNELRLKARDVGSLTTPMAVQVINAGAAIVDVRAPEQFAAGHIVDARNVPADELLNKPDTLKNQKKNTLLVCETGTKSAEVVTKLRKEGLDNVFSVKGGLAAWQQENLPVVTDGKN